MDKKIKNISVGFSNSIFNQFSFLQNSNEHFDYTNYKGFPKSEKIIYDMFDVDIEFFKFSIITKSFILDTPMDDISLSKLVSSFVEDLDNIVKSFPDSFRFISELEISIHYNNYGSTFLEWEFNIIPNKMKKLKNNGGVEVLFDFLIDFDLYEFENILDTLNDIDLLKGDILYDVVSSEDDEVIKEYFELFIQKHKEFGYELETIDFYVENYGIEKNIVEDVINKILDENV